MSKNTQNIVSSPIVTTPAKGMTVSPESVAAIATVANPSPQSEEAAKAARLAAAKEAEKAAIAKRLEKIAARELELEQSPVFRLCGETLKTVALERAIGAVDRESGRVRKEARERGFLTVKEAADGKSQLIYDAKAVKAVVSAGYASKATEKDIVNMRKLISACVYFGLMPRPATMIEDDEE